MNSTNLYFHNYLVQLRLYMKIHNILLYTATFLFLLSCDSDTVSLGGSITPQEDNINVKADIFHAVSRSIKANDSLLARTSQCYLGRFTDPETGSMLEADFMTQFNCIENFEFPDSVYGLDIFNFPDWVSPTLSDTPPFKAELRLFFKSFFGDKSNSLKIEVYPLGEVLNETTKHYTNFDPADYYDSNTEPLVSVMVSPVDYSVNDSIRQLATYYRNICIKLPDSIAENLIKKYYIDPKGKGNFANALEFINNVCKGFYLKCVQGDGTIFYIDRSELDINFKYLEVSSSGRADSLISAVAQFAGNSEVIQINRFNNQGIEPLIADSTCTYLKTPYGILTEVTLPVDDIIQPGKILNSAIISFTRLNTYGGTYKLKIPETIIMIRESEALGFFEKNLSLNNVTSYFTSFTSEYNQYTFSNIARLIRTCADEREQWLTDNGLLNDSTGRSAYYAANPHWNKVVLVPAQATRDANNNIVNFSLDLSMSSVKLQGGSNGEKIAIKTIHTTFE